jgi:hypothetical protein
MIFPESYAKRWRILAVAAFLGAFAVQIICHDVFRNDKKFCFVPYVLLQLSAALFSIIAAIRGSKSWFVMTFFTVALAIQASVAIVVE